MAEDERADSRAGRPPFAFDEPFRNKFAVKPASAEAKPKRMGKSMKTKLRFYLTVTGLRLIITGIKKHCILVALCVMSLFYDF